MTPLAFLQAVYPPNAHYCIASPFIPDGADKPIYGHKVFTDLQQMVRYAERMKGDRDIFFSVLTLKAPSVWNAAKRNRKTGELGAHEIRTHKNMHEAKCFFLDLDVGKSTSTVTKYPSQAKAADALKQFCKELGLPKPMVVSSGYGLHIYWLLSDALPADDWYLYAVLLHKLVKAKGLLADPSRVSDRSSVLRLPGTTNHKNGEQRPVEVLIKSAEIDTLTFVKRLKAACVELELDMTPRPKVMAGAVGNLNADYSGKVPSLENLLSSCDMMKTIYEHGGGWPYDVWHKSLAVFRCVDDGVAVCHEWSARDYAGYDAAVTDQKLYDQEMQSIGPTSCAAMQDVYGDKSCGACTLAGKVKGPASASLWPKAAPPRSEEAPVAVTSTVSAPAPRLALEVPDGYIRTVDNKIVWEMPKADGKKTPVVILEYDLRPLVEQVDGDSRAAQYVWAAKFPRGEATEFVLPSWVISDPRALQKELSDNRILVTPEKTGMVQTYMSAYMRKLQRDADADQQFVHLGWHNGYTQFALGDRLLLPGGKSKKINFCGNGHSSVATLGLSREGTLAKQVELMRFFNKPQMLPHQFLILASLGSILLHMTGLHGVIVALHGTTGGSKSTALMAAMSFWGNPVTAVRNGMSNGDTAMSRDNFIHGLRNLPFSVDEVSKLSDDDCSTLAYGISQPAQRVRSDKGGVNKVVDAKVTAKSLTLLATTNESLHTKLARDQSKGSASSMRVIEIDVPPIFHTTGKEEADRYIAGFKENYGWIGEEFARFVVDNYEDVKAAVINGVVNVDKEAETTTGERFYSAKIACVVIAGKIANHLGLLDFDHKAVKYWAVKQLIPQLRGVVADEYITPLTFVSGLIGATIQECVWVSGRNGNLFNDRVPLNGIVGRYEKSNGMLWITMDRVKRYAALRKVSLRQMTQELESMGLIIGKNVRKVLAKGTEYEAARDYTYLFDMTREELVDAVVEAEKNLPPHLKIVK